MYNGKRVVVTMTTYPKRIKGIQKCLQSILDNKFIDGSNLKPSIDEVVINLSIDEFPNKELDLPDFLRSGKRSDKISINYLYGNTKAFKKLIPTLNNPKYEDSIVITCDDDCIYPDTIFYEALNEYTGESPVAFNVPSLYNWGNGKISIYERKFFDKTLTALERPEVWKTNNDDVAYGYLLKLNGRKFRNCKLACYDFIECTDPCNDMHKNALYDSYDDMRTIGRYIFDRFGLSMYSLQENWVVKMDSDPEKKDNTNELVND